MTNAASPSTPSSSPDSLPTTAMTIGAFSDALASRASTPGGGGAAALTGSQAAALLSMVINFTLGNKKYAAVEATMTDYLRQSEQLRHALLAMADQDVVAFTAVTACYAMPRESAEEKAARTAALQQALKGAAEVPFTTAQHCLAVLALTAGVASQGNTNVVSDAATALYLAQAALHSAIINVNINLKFIKDDEYVTAWTAKRDELLARARAAYQTGKTACEQALEMAL